MKHNTMMTTRPSADHGRQVGVKRGSKHTAPQAPPYGGGEASAFRPKFFTTRPSVNPGRQAEAALGRIHIASGQDDPKPEPPEAPGANECCESGCVPCVYDLYAEAMQEYREALAAWERRQAGE